MPENFKQFDLAVSKARVPKTVENTPPRVSSFYICPYDESTRHTPISTKDTSVIDC